MQRKEDWRQGIDCHYIIADIGLICILKYWNSFKNELNWIRFITAQQIKKMASNKTTTRLKMKISFIKSCHDQWKSYKKIVIGINEWKVFTNNTCDVAIESIMMKAINLTFSNQLNFSLRFCIQINACNYLYYRVL